MEASSRGSARAEALRPEVLSLIQEDGQWPGQGAHSGEDEVGGRKADPMGKPRRLMWIPILSCE